MDRNSKAGSASDGPHDQGRVISSELRIFMREVADRNKGYGLCWRCLEHHRGLVEVEFRGWLCPKCRAATE
jgi:hypothetical protein